MMILIFESSYQVKTGRQNASFICVLMTGATGLLYRFYIPSVRNLRRCRCVIPSLSFLVSRGVMEIIFLSLINEIFCKYTKSFTYK